MPAKPGLGDEPGVPYVATGEHKMVSFERTDPGKLRTRKPPDVVGVTPVSFETASRLVKLQRPVGSEALVSG